MKETDKTKDQLVGEIAALRRRVAQLERLKAEGRQAEKALLESEEKYRSLVENVGLGVFRTTPGASGRFLEVNPAMEKITGYSREELLQMNVCNLYLNPEERESVLEEITSATEKVTKELDFKKKDGSPIVVSDTKVAVRNSAGKVLYFDGIIEDITEHKQVQERLIISDRLVSVGELTSEVVRELSNPLTSIIGFAESLLEEEVSDEARENIAIIHHEAKRATEVMKNLLAFARKHTPSRQAADINSIIATVLGLRNYEHKVNNIRTKTYFAPDLLLVMADGFQLQQVFFNIIINAEYFMLQANGGGTLTITTQRAGDFVLAAFSDDGPGIPQENMGRLFDPFFTTKEAGKGAGLGLSICHGIVTGHGGRLYAQSERGKGATFVVELPVGAVTSGLASDDVFWVQFK